MGKLRSLPMQAGTPVCCGSNTVHPGSKLSKTGNFSRQSAAGSFQVLTLPTEDKFPPSRVIDLKASSSCGDNFTMMFTSPGDNLDGGDKVKSYTVKYASTPLNLTGENFNNDNFNTVLDANMILMGDLNPVEAGQVVEVTLNATK